jgi:NAD(P)-dependent dehydrogenase (short-subunit alcohol dehydrogenase family)
MAQVPPLDGKVALVTGASGGIGAAVARSLQDAGA